MPIFTIETVAGPVRVRAASEDAPFTPVGEVDWLRMQLANERFRRLLVETESRFFKEVAPKRWRHLSIRRALDDAKLLGPRRARQTSTLRALVAKRRRAASDELALKARKLMDSDPGLTFTEIAARLSTEERAVSRQWVSRALSKRS